MILTIANIGEARFV